MLIQFKYKLSQSLAELANKEIIDFNNDYVIGWMDQSDSGQLHHCSLYMVCELEIHDALSILRNPIAIVARNDGQALTTYSKATNKMNGTIMCEITDNCEKIYIEPTWVTIK